VWITALVLTIKALPILPNQGHRGRHWAVEAKYRREWHLMVRCAVGLLTPVSPLDRARVTLTRVSKREPDTDNLMASWKPILDGLVRARVLFDDSPAHVELVSRWRRTTGPGFVVVEVNAL
jgi:Holliday junction resolvase RusA-like endonuclease